MVFLSMKKLLTKLVLYQIIFLVGKILFALFVRTRMKKLESKSKLINFHVALPITVLRTIHMMKKKFNHAEDSYLESINQRR